MVSVLHISDLHLTRNPHASNLQDAILSYARDKFHDIPEGQKLLIITGDLRNYQQKDYALSKAFLEELIGAMDVKPSQDVFIVPGNHDVSPPSGSGNCDDILKLLNRDRTSRKELNQAGKFHDESMSKLLSRYEAYLEFAREMGIYDAASEPLLPVRTHVRTWRDRLHILHLNTALIADGTTKTNQMADAVEATSREVKEQLRDKNLPCIAIGHNSFMDLDKALQNQLKGAFFHSAITAYLCGDRHQTAKKLNERAILLRDNPAVALHNIVAPRGSCDPMDNYSDVGMILHEWNEHTGQVKYTVQFWTEDSQTEIQNGTSREYVFCNYQPPKAFVTPPLDAGSASAPVTASAPSAGKLSPQEEQFLADIQSLFDEYSFLVSIGRVCFVGKRLIDMLHDPKINRATQSLAMVNYQNLLRKTITEMESDFDDLRPDKSDRIAKLKKALADLKAL